MRGVEYNSVYHKMDARKMNECLRPARRYMKTEGLQIKQVCEWNLTEFLHISPETWVNVWARLKSIDSGSFRNNRSKIFICYSVVDSKLMIYDKQMINGRERNVEWETTVLRAFACIMEAKYSIQMVPRTVNSMWFNHIGSQFIAFRSGCTGEVFRGDEIRFIRVNGFIPIIESCMGYMWEDIYKLRLAKGDTTTKKAAVSFVKKILQDAGVPLDDLLIQARAVSSNYIRSIYLLSMRYVSMFLCMFLFISYGCIVVYGCRQPSLARATSLSSPRTGTATGYVHKCVFV